MPWKECSVVDEHLRFVAWLLDGEAMSEVCRAFGISRKTGYKIFERYKEHSLEALTDRSRAPRLSRRELSRGGTASMPVREKRTKEVGSQPARPFSRPHVRAHSRESAGLFAYSPGVQCRDRLSGGGSGIRTAGPILQRKPDRLPVRVLAFANRRRRPRAYWHEVLARHGPRAQES
jgi:hypothetical protein